MPRTVAARKYGKPSNRSKAERLFAELPQTPVRKRPVVAIEDAVSCLADEISTVSIKDTNKEARAPRRSPRKSTKEVIVVIDSGSQGDDAGNDEDVYELEVKVADLSLQSSKVPESAIIDHKQDKEDTSESLDDTPSLRQLTWDDVCTPEDQIEKIAEASYAEVYRVTNERGTSIIKVIRLESPIKAQTKAQVRSGLVDEEPHSEDDVNGELQISEWLADIPGFVVYKERYMIQGKATRQLLETHQAFQKRMKRKDPGRAQFYPSPSRYLDETKFLVVELGDAGQALEDWKLDNESQLWDIFFLEAVALARAEDLAMFEHRDLHEGNLCVKQTSSPRERDNEDDGFFGYSGLDITILDYGLSRAEDLSVDYAKPVAFDLERDLSLFTSTHAAQCKVYRQMRSFLLRADRKCLPPEAHDKPYEKGIDGPLSWDAFAPYTNVLWLAYMYEYLIENFRGGKKELKRFTKETGELWAYLNPDAKEDVPCFGSAADVVCFAVEAGWIREDQLLGPGESSIIEGEGSIVIAREEGIRDESTRRSPRRQ